MPAKLQALRQELCQQLDLLPEDKLQQAFDFVQYLLVKDTLTLPTTKLESYTQERTVKELLMIREKATQTYGVYDGDLVAEAREERTKDMDTVFGLGKSE